MELVRYETAKEFSEAAHTWLLQNEGVNAIAIGVSAMQQTDDPPYKEDFYAAIWDAGKVVGTAMMTPPHPININADSESALPLFIDFAEQIRQPQSVLGPGVFAKKFAQLWCERKDCRIGHEEAQAIHQLRQLSRPPLRGEVQVARQDDYDLLVKWSEAFCRDCDLEDSIPEVPKMAKTTIENQNRYLLKVGNKTVSMAAISRETDTGGTINWVYTPNDERGNGYASMLVGHLCQKILDKGKESVFLYTQLDNPTSNKIYYDLGFRVLSDSWHIRFDY